MRVQDWMTTDVVVVAPTTPAAECRQRMRECGVRNLPVVDDEALIGRVTDATAFGRHPTDAVAADLMAPVPVIARPDDLLRDALAQCAWSMQDAVFVVERGRIVGILTEHDAVKHAVDLLPAHLTVREAGSTSPVSVDADTPIEDAQEEMRKRFMRHLLVSDGGNLFGVISMRDVLVRRDVSGRSEGVVRDLIRGPVVWTIGWDATLREAARVMVEHQVGCLPIVREGDVRPLEHAVGGVICRSDILRAMTRWKVVDPDPNDPALVPGTSR